MDGLFVRRLVADQSFCNGILAQVMYPAGVEIVTIGV